MPWAPRADTAETIIPGLIPDSIKGVVPAAADELPVAKPATRTGGFGRLTRVRVEGATTREVLDDLRGDR